MVPAADRLRAAPPGWASRARLRRSRAGVPAPSTVLLENPGTVRVDGDAVNLPACEDVTVEQQVILLRELATHGDLTPVEVTAISRASRQCGYRGAFTVLSHWWFQYDVAHSLTRAEWSGRKQAFIAALTRAGRASPGRAYPRPRPVAVGPARDMV